MHRFWQKPCTRTAPYNIAWLMYGIGQSTNQQRMRDISRETERTHPLNETWGKNDAEPFRGCACDWLRRHIGHGFRGACLETGLWPAAARLRACGPVDPLATSRRGRASSDLASPAFPIRKAHRVALALPDRCRVRACFPDVDGLRMGGGAKPITGAGLRRAHGRGAVLRLAARLRRGCRCTSHGPGRPSRAPRASRLI